MSDRGAILIVDDEPAVCRLFRHSLEEAGYICHVAHDTRQARRVLREMAVELILCDIVLPGESGLSLVADVLSRRNDVAVLMVTGQEEPRISRAALDQGVYGYLIKPVGKNQLRVSVENAFRRLHLEKENRRHILRLERIVAQRDRTVVALQNAHRKIVDQQRSVAERERLRALLEIAGATAHQINQPLTTLLAHIELMEMEAPDAGAMLAHGKEVSAAGWKIAEIVKRIQTIRRDETLAYLENLHIVNLEQEISGLVVAGSEIDWEPIWQAIRKIGYARFQRANTCQAALEALDKKSFDLVLLYHDPTSDTTRCEEKMLRYSTEIPVVVICESDDPSIVAPLIQEGAFEVISRSQLQEDHIVKTICRAMEKSILQKKMCLIKERLENFES